MNAANPTISLWRRLCHTRLRDVLRGRLDASLDWRQVMTSADLPDELASAVGHVVAKARLWRSEKVAVATELIAHFQDGLAAGHSPEELLTAFGDPQTAAQLIRRAKRRGRPLVWHVCHYGWMGVLALVGVYIAMGLWMSLGRPTVRTDYLAIINQRAMSVPDAKRAWPLYRSALSAMGVNVAKRFQEPWSEYMVAGSAKPGDENWLKTEQFLRQHTDSIAKLREAASRRDLGLPAATLPADVSPQDREIFGVTITPEQMEAAKRETVQHRWVLSILLPDLELLRWAASLLANDARCAGLAGDGDTAFANVVALFGVSRHCEEKPFFVSLLSATEVQKQAFAVIQETLTQYPDLWTDAQLRDLAHKIATAQIDWQRGFEAERAVFDDLMQRLYTDDGHGDGRLVLQVGDGQNLFDFLESTPLFVSEVGVQPPAPSKDVLATLMLPAANMVVASRKEMTGVYDRFSDRALQMLETPLWEKGYMEAEIGAFLHGNPLGRIRYLFIELLLPAYDSVRGTNATQDGTRDGVLIGIALELYHREHKAWPKTLEELSPRWLPELPVDLINGGPLGYRIVGDRPLVYCLGVDRDDDGGRLPANCEGDATKYRVSETYEIPAVTTEHVRGWHDGDWVIWSTANSE